MVAKVRYPACAPALVVGMLLCLTSCAGGGYYDDSFNSEDAVGVWVSSDTPSVVTLTRLFAVEGVARDRRLVRG